MIKIQKTPKFDAWLSHFTIKEEAQIEARLYRIEAFDHFGDCIPKLPQESVFCGFIRPGVRSIANGSILLILIRLRSPSPRLLSH